MEFIGQLLGNQVLTCSMIGWTIAQLLKTLIDFGLNRSFSAERLVGSGGMPSSHSATVCALTTSSGLCYGVSSFEFAVSFVFASVVMYDAIGVRQVTGKQSKLLNLILEQDFFKMNNLQFQETLKEFVGHTPIQVLAGAILGVATALVANLYY